MVGRGELVRLVPQVVRRGRGSPARRRWLCPCPGPCPGPCLGPVRRALVGVLAALDALDSRCCRLRRELKPPVCDVQHRQHSRVCLESYRHKEGRIVYSHTG